jgi:energy-coupling factor transporter transmembrane protein EcfT
MGVGLLIGLFLLIVFLFFFLWLFINSKKKKSKVGIVISSIALVCILLLFFTNNIDELTISKEDVKKDLKQIDIELNSNFEIKENTVSGMAERNQTTEIEISKTEIEKIITEIKQSKNFQEYKTESEVYNDDISLNVPLNGQILNIKYPKYYSRELYKEIDNIPTRIFLTIYVGENILKYQKFED